RGKRPCSASAPARSPTLTAQTAPRRWKRVSWTPARRIRWQSRGSCTAPRRAPTNDRSVCRERAGSYERQPVVRVTGVADELLIQVTIDVARLREVARLDIIEQSLERHDGRAPPRLLRRRELHHSAPFRECEALRGVTEQLELRVQLEPRHRRLGGDTRLVE